MQCMYNETLPHSHPFNTATITGLKVYFWVWEHLCEQVYIFRHTAKILGAEL